MNSESLRRLNDIITEAVRSLFASRGMEARLRPVELDATPTSCDMVCSIGFTSDIMRGCLVLAMPSSLVLATLPPEATSSDAASDWLGELSNQLLGRIKNRLIPYGVAFALSTPSVVVGERLFRRPSKIPVAVAHVFDSSVGTACIWFDAEVGPDTGVVSEGGVALF
jgi:CheY-specific phosphatase CheX